MNFAAQFQANQMVQNIREAFIENLETVNWMDSQTKQAAKEKVRSLHNSGKIAYECSYLTLIG